MVGMLCDNDTLLTVNFCEVAECPGELVEADGSMLPLPHSDGTQGTGLQRKIASSLSCLLPQSRNGLSRDSDVAL